MKNLFTIIVFLFSALAMSAENEITRPKITGVAHAAFFTKDLDNTREFFKDYLGYGECIVMPDKNGGTAFTVIKINDRQYVELFPERSVGTPRMYHFAIETDDAEGMRRYLESKGYKVPESTPKGRTGNSNYFVYSPDGSICEIVQYEPESMTIRDAGKYLPGTRVSARMSHVGFMVADLEKAMSFYVDVLGFKEVWRGGPDPKKVKWVHLQVPEGDETIELMLHDSEPSWQRMGSMNHICLEVKDVEAVESILSERKLPEGCPEPSAISTGINKKRQKNYYCIDGTRVEIMEDHTVTGYPAPSSEGYPMKYVPEYTVEITDAVKGGSLQEKIASVYAKDLSSIISLKVNSGMISPEDCRFIKENLTSLEELVVGENADFEGGIIGKSAFEGMKSLRYVHAENAVKILTKAFSLCEGLQVASFPKVKEIGVQGFAQAKGSNKGQLRIASFPSLEKLQSRAFYYCTNLKSIYFETVPQALKPEGKEGLWMERVTNVVIHIPSREVYDAFVQKENCINLDWSAFNFIADNGDELPKIVYAEKYDDSKYDCLRESLLPTFDKSDKDFSGEYYTGDYKLSLNMYSLNMNINAWIRESDSAPQLNTMDAIRWAAEAGFDAVDLTCYYIPGYSNTTMPTLPEKEIVKYARNIKKLCRKLDIEISGTGIQNNFADPNRNRRETDVERIKFWIGIAAEMGAPVIRIFAGPPPADINREGWEKIARERMVPHIQEVADFAKEKYPQVRIGLQNHGGMLATANQVIQVLEWIDRDNVGIINDTGFYRDFLSTDASGYDWYRDISLVLPYTNNFQIKKKPGGAETKELMDLEHLARLIRQSPYRGYLPIELLWLNRDKGYPGDLQTPPFEEITDFLNKLKDALEKTKLPPIAQHTTPAQLSEQVLALDKAPFIVKDSDGMPIGDLEEISPSDVLHIYTGNGVREYNIDLVRTEYINLILNPEADKVKKSSFQKGSDPLNAFNGKASGFSGSGFVVDKSQAESEDNNRFWLAADMGSSRIIDAFGVAWGTSVNQLKKRLKDGRYEILCTDSDKLWKELSDAAKSGKSWMKGYSEPEGWYVAHTQKVEELPDANGNKVFIHNLVEPVKARYVLISGELTDSSIEIYNFFAYRKEMKSVSSEESPETEDIARIMPEYPGMSMAPGRPALVRLGTELPVFVVKARENICLSAEMTDSKGNVIFRKESEKVSKGNVIRIETGLKAEDTGLYTVRFRLDGDTTVHDALYFNVIDGDILSYTYENPYPALGFNNGKLEYYPDYKGNTVADYSYTGYRNSSAPIPNVPVRIALEPSKDKKSDDTERIQKALDMVGRYPADIDGIRGAVLLKAGTYRISSPLTISQSGIVLKGEGDGHESVTHHSKPLGPDNWFDYAHSEKEEKGVTKLVATWVSDSYDKNTAIITIGGGKAKDVWSTEITDQYVPVNAVKIHVKDVSGLKAGDVIRIERAVNGAWAHDLRMDSITDAPGILSENQWAENGKILPAYKGISQERRIKAVLEDAIVLEEPLVDPLNMKYGISRIYKIDCSSRVRNSGAENMMLMSRFDKNSTSTNSAYDKVYKFYDDESHAQVGIKILNAEDVWARRITTYHIDVAATVMSGSCRASIQDINCLDPVSGTGGERRYSFSNSGGSFILNQRNYTRYTRHGFIVMGHVMGPNVFLNNTAEYQFDANEPHLRWSAGGMYDNVKGRIYIQNRWNNGTAHGWSGANYMLYNCEGEYIISQNPLAANYIIGQKGDRIPFIMNEVDPGNVPNFMAHETPSSDGLPESLFIQQLKDRLGEDACEWVADSGIGDVIDETAGFYESFAVLDGITADGKSIEGFDSYTFSYELPVELDYTAFPSIGHICRNELKVTETASDGYVKLLVEGPGLIPSEYEVKFATISKEYISSDKGNSGLERLLDKDHKSSWSGSGTPYIQFYLGEKPVAIEAISLGYVRNTQSRRQYYFEFEVSDDGYEWKRINPLTYEPDNLGKGHIMGMQLLPGPGNNPDDYETFMFAKGIKARLFRIRMFGARFGRGKGTTNANSYWSIDLKTR